MQKLKDYVKNSYQEIKKVQWPSREQTVRLTVYVIGVSLVVGLFVTVVDYGYKEALALIIK